MFHPPASTDQAVGLGYVSNDGHVFTCRNPVVVKQAFHVYVLRWLVPRFLTSNKNTRIFVIDRYVGHASGDGSANRLQVWLHE